MFLSALACVAFEGSAFANNEIVVEKQSEIEKVNQEDECVSCPITIVTKDQYGNIISRETKNYRVCTMTCEQAEKQVGTFLQTGKILAPSK